MKIEKIINVLTNPFTHMVSYGPLKSHVMFYNLIIRHINTKKNNIDYRILHNFLIFKNENKYYYKINQQEAVTDTIPICP